MAKTEDKLKAVVRGNTRETDSLRLCIRSKLPPQERDSSCGGGRGSENGMAEDLLQNQGNHVKESWELAEEVGTELSSSSLDNEKPQECEVCRKKFPSRKSLYGHMRLHPDRGWRGVQLPDEEVEQDPVFDYPQAVIPGWLVTGKRGRRSADSVMSGLNSPSVKADSSTRGNKEKVKRGDEAGNRTVTEVESKIPPEKMPPEDPRGDKEEARGKNSCVGRENQKSKRLIKRKARELDGTGHGRRAKKAAGDASGRASTANHTCSRCHKSFPSFQALGGHRSSCNKTKQSTTAGQATDANVNMPGMWSWQPRLDLSLSLFTPGSSTNDTGCNNMTDFHPNTNELPRTAESEDNELNMIKFL